MRVREAVQGVAVVAIGAMLAGGCSGGGKGGGGHTIAFVPGCTCDPYYSTEIKAVQDEAKKLGMKVFVSGPANFDAAEQTTVLQAVVRRHPDAIIIDPTDAKAMVAPINAAVAAGIKVMTTGNNVNTDKRFTAIAASSIEGGRAAARELAKLAPQGGTVLINNVKPGISSTDDRDKGFREELSGNPKFTILDTQYSGDDQNKAAQNVSSTLRAHPDLVGVFATNVITANGTASALRLAHKGDQVVAIGYDAGPEEARDLRDGLLDAIISQNPDQIGRLAVQNTKKYLDGDTGIPKDQPLTPMVIDKSNLDSDEAQAALYKG